MTLRKISFDNSVRYVPKSEQTKQIQGEGKPNKRKQNEKFSKNNKKFVKDFTARGFGILK